MTDSEGVMRAFVSHLTDALRTHAEWITDDPHLRATATNLAVERQLTPEFKDRLVPLIQSRLSPEEFGRLASALEAGELDDAWSILEPILGEGFAG